MLNKQSKTDPQIPVSINTADSEHLLRTAELSGDLDRMKMAVDIRAARAQERKASAEAANAEAQYPELSRRRSFYERLLSTAQGTAALALLTIVCQIVQFGYTAGANRLATEDAQWKDVVKGLSFEPDARSVSSVMNLATFYRSPRYAANAKALVAAILPVIPNRDTFDRAFVNLADETAWGDEGNLYTVARAVSEHYLNDINHANATYGTLIPILLNQKLSALLDAKAKDLAAQGVIDAVKLKDIRAALDEAKLREWEIDSCTHFLKSYWAKHGTQPPPDLLSGWSFIRNEKPYSADFSKILFRYDDSGPVDLAGYDFRNASLVDSLLIGVDFTGAKLTGANLSRATLTGSLLAEVREFDRSDWKDADWWNAASISNELCGYLKAKYGPPAASAQAAAERCPR